MTERALGPFDLFKVFLRLLIFQALLNARGLQNLSFAGAISPVADKIEGDDGNAMLLRHLRYFNSNPNFASLIIGGVLKLEVERANGKPVSDKDIEYFKTSLAGPLAAMGDMLFLENLRPLALTCACIFAIHNSLTGLLAVFMLYNLVVVSCRLWGVCFGYSKGWELVDVFTGTGYQRILSVAQGIGATAGGALLAAILYSFPENGRWVLFPAGAVAVIALYLLRKDVPASWFAIILFPTSALFAVILG